MVALRLFAKRDFAIGNVTTFLMSGAVFAGGLLVTEEFQLARHFSPVGAGVRLLRDSFPEHPALDIAVSHALLTRVQNVEAALGRDRTKERRWGPRPIDIDILAYDDVVLREPDLTLPHPHLFERAFVLLPLAEIAADRIIAGRRVGDALAGSDITGIDKLPRRQTEAPR